MTASAAPGTPAVPDRALPFLLHYIRKRPLLFGGVLAGLGVVLALGAALAHLLVPVLVLCGLIWLIRALARPSPPALGSNV